VIALFWSPQSLDDLGSIRAYIAQDSPVYADLVVRRLVRPWSGSAFSPNPEESYRNEMIR
jgi:plasmid stabilization system protein ParE